MSITTTKAHQSKLLILTSTQYPKPAILQAPKTFNDQVKKKRSGSEQHHPTIGRQRKELGSRV
jgi:hypothetical protein